MNISRRHFRILFQCDGEFMSLVICALDAEVPLRNGMKKPKFGLVILIIDTRIGVNGDMYLGTLTLNVSILCLV